MPKRTPNWPLYNRDSDSGKRGLLWLLFSAMVKITDKVHKDEDRAFQFGEHADQFYNLGRKFVGIDEK